MRAARFCQSVWGRCLIAVLVPFLVLAFVNFQVDCSWALGAPPKKKPPEEEIEDPGAAKQPAKPPLRVPHGKKSRKKAEDKTAPEVPDQPTISGPAELARRAKDAPDRAQRELYAALARPYDVIITGVIQREIVPVATYLGDPPSFDGEMHIQRYANGKAQKALPFTARMIGGYKPYEQIAVERVDDYLSKQRTLTNDGPNLSQLQAASTILDAVLRWHRSALQRGTRLGDGWERFETMLRDKLLDVLLQQLKIHVEKKQWEPAYGLSARLADNYPKDKKVELATLEFLAAEAQDSADKAEASNSNDDWRHVAELWRRMHQQYPDSPHVRNLGPRIEGKARSLKELADKQLKANHKAEAIVLLRDAEGLWPQLNGLHETLIQVSGQFLYIGVPHLPVNLSPATAATDTERQCLDLLFESLVRPGYTEKFGQRYVLDLAAQQPRMIPLGRHFSVRPDVVWSDGTRLSGVDVRHTVQSLIDSGRTNLLRPAELGADDNQLDLKLNQGYIDPLALMSFKILPAGLQHLDDPEFAQKPLGSGPFRLKSRSSEEVVFEANPYYGGRRGAAGLPRIKEIHFFVSNDHRRDFTDQGGATHKMDLLLGLSRDDVKEIGSLEPMVHVQAMRNRRIYFLAVNHRRVALQNIEVRKVLANAINRAAILDSVFRDPNSTVKPHRPLLGAYPPGSWAAQTKTPLEPFDPQVAQASAAKLDGTMKLTLKYPDGDPDVEAACEKIVAAVRPYGISLDAKAVEESQLRHDVEQNHDYDLAYYHWDFPTEDYTIWPLFDPNAANNEQGTNYLGYVDSELTSYLERLKTVRDIHKVHEAAHLVQGLVRAKLPFIPLWQLDTYVAMHQDLTVTHVDPLRPFIDVAHWQLVRQH